MTEQLKKIINDELVKLPEKMQKAINSVDWPEITKEVGLKYLTTDEAINKLQTEVLLVLINMEYLDNLKLNIENYLITTNDSAEKISKELIEKVFKQITAKLNEDIKNNLKYKNTSWDQTINFIVSGGDYSVFEEENKDIPKPKVEYREVI